jgi:acyl-CoA dehydrogenase
LKALRTTAEDKGDHYIVNGQNVYNQWFYVRHGYCSGKTNVNTDQEGVTLLIMESSMEGFSKGIPFKKIGMKSQDTCELFLIM